MRESRQPSRNAPPCPGRLDGSDARPLDPRLAAGFKDGYSFALETSGDRFHVHANPIVPGRTGRRRFYVGSTRYPVGTRNANGPLVRFHLTRPATSGDSPIE